MDNSAAIDGTLVAANDSSSSTGELHSDPYTGTFPGSPTAAPEPASLALVGSGIAGLAAIRRRRRRVYRRLSDRSSKAVASESFWR